MEHLYKSSFVVCLGLQKRSSLQLALPVMSGRFDVVLQGRDVMLLCPTLSCVNLVISMLSYSIVITNSMFLELGYRVARYT